MNRYSVMFTVDASVTVDVDAENEEQAKERAWAQVSSPSVCHQCSREVEVGEIMDLVEVLELHQ